MADEEAALPVADCSWGGKSRTQGDCLGQIGDRESPLGQSGEALAEIKEENISFIAIKIEMSIKYRFFSMDKCSLGGLDLTEQTPVLLGSKAMAASLTDVGNSFGDSTSPLVNRSRNSSTEDDDDDDVVFIESIQPPSNSPPAIADQRNFKFASSRNEKLRGNYSVILPSSRELASQKGNTSDTIVIDDEEDVETNGGKKKNSSSFIEWGLPGTKNRAKDLDFSTSSLSRSKVNAGMGYSVITTESTLKFVLLMLQP
ncbi:hypothetical protein HPG69_017542 [Diceros bicornis minor]|uniref:Zinc finger MYM-type protein 5 n=1 Tax=Diceros bicornis minor TaxID=77932 RepID=A0A7J7EKP0_DICBM|nr:hypothetical protein HPG69_017542 [Diceros bicornis minor]